MAWRASRNEQWWVPNHSFLLANISISKHLLTLNLFPKLSQCSGQDWYWHLGPGRVLRQPRHPWLPRADCHHLQDIPGAGPVSHIQDRPEDTTHLPHDHRGSLLEGLCKPLVFVSSRQLSSRVSRTITTSTRQTWPSPPTCCSPPLHWRTASLL